MAQVDLRGKRFNDDTSESIGTAFAQPISSCARRAHGADAINILSRLSSVANILPMPMPHTPSAFGTALRAVFGPRWYIRGARVLGIQSCYAVDLGSGRRRPSRRHWRILDTYARNRANAASSEIKAAEARARRRAQTDLARLEQARQTIRSLLKENG